MPWLTVAGIDLEIVSDGSAVRKQAVTIGERARAFNEPLRNSVRATNRVP